MSFYYPQACIKLRILPEDFKLVSDAALQKPYEVTVVARDLTVNVNDHKTSDSFHCEIDFKHFPFDPRAIRYCGVVIYLQDMESVYNPDGSLNVIVPTEENTVFSGFVDEETLSFDESRRTVRFEGRDFTSLLIDQKYAENVPVDLGRPIDQVIGKFLKTFKATQELKIVNLTGNTTLPTLTQFYPDFGSPLAGQRNPGSKESYWEIIQDIATRAGVICYMHLDKLIITTPRNLYNPKHDLKFIYGANIKNLTYKRKLGRLKNFNILVRSRVGKTVLTAKIPEEATAAWAASFGIPRVAATVPVLKPDGALDPTQTHPAPYLAFPIPNIGDKDQLIRIGESVYEDYSRQQLEGSFDTMEMVGHSGTDQGDPNFQDFDLTQLDIGQPIAIEIATDDLMQITRLTDESARTRYLVTKNYDPVIAAAFAKSMGKTSPRFYTKSYTLTLNQDQGFKLHIEFINIIELSHRGMSDGIAFDDTGKTSSFGALA